MGDSDWFWSFVDVRRSFRGVVDPVLGWRMASDAGRGPLNVVGGHRVSYQPSGPTVTVWWFGGSTMFGLVQRDDHTIPSEVARLAERDGIRIRSVNFGVEGYNAMQEALAFGLALGGDRGSAAPPDLAVFYDGANELATAVERVDVGRTDPDDVYFQAVSEDERAARGTSRRTAALSPDERTALTVDLGAAQYRRAAAIVTDLARGADVPVVHLWQPLLATTARQGFEAPLLDVLDVDPDGLSQVRSVYDRMRSSSGVDPVDLSDAMTGATGPTFFDFEHTNERGARIVARRIYAAIRSTLVAQSERR